MFETVANIIFHVLRGRNGSTQDLKETLFLIVQSVVQGDLLNPTNSLFFGQPTSHEWFCIFKGKEKKNMQQKPYVVHKAENIYLSGLLWKKVADPWSDELNYGRLMKAKHDND